ncbi:MAG TPA: hypothetical protein VH988_05390 [Thermoanaerobaculia bacterium]|nr:hypothetical protein [Thermoanaerobaculia bacterium]
MSNHRTCRRGGRPLLVLPNPLEAAQIQAQVRRYIDQHGWDVTDGEGRWRQYQQARMADEYRADDW